MPEAAGQEPAVLLRPGVGIGSATRGVVTKIKVVGQSEVDEFSQRLTSRQTQPLIQFLRTSGTSTIK